MKHFTILFTLVLTALTAKAQHGPPPLSPERMQEVRAQKSAYLTARLSLTTDEAQRFWPVYNKYDEETGALRSAIRDRDKELRDREGGMSEADAISLMDLEQTNRQKELDLTRKFNVESRTLIGAVRTVELGRAERDFHREMLKRLRNDPAVGPSGRHRDGARSTAPKDRD